MKPALWARRTHKWIALVIGVQALLWMLSGLYMTAISIDTIHGDHLVHRDIQPLSSTVPLIRPDAQRYPRLTGFKLKRFMGREVFELQLGVATRLVDARTGAQISPLDETTARTLAQSHYIGNAPIRSIEQVHKPPQEVSTRPAPMWRVEFADRKETTLYFSPSTGELLAKRHDLWRWFDLLWMLHIMDYDERSDVNNMLLRITSTVGLVFALSGLWLLIYSFGRRRTA